MKRDEKRWRLRTGIEDRPGTLAALATTLGVHEANVLRIDVVSRDERAVDDIWIELPPGGRIESLDLVLRRLPGVDVRALFPVAEAEDPVSVFAGACALAATATGVEALYAAAIDGACRVGSAEHATLVSAAADGSLRVLAATDAFETPVPSHAACLARETVFGGIPVSVPGSYPWAPESWRARVSATWVAAMPLRSGNGISSCLMLVRERAFPFESGELSRVSDFGRVVAALSAPYEQASPATDAASWRIGEREPDVGEVLAAR